MKKKILSILLAVVMLTSILPMSAISAYAASYTVSNVRDNGTSVTYNKGDTIKEVMNNTGALYIDGEKVLNPYTTKSYTVEYCLKYDKYSNGGIYLVSNCSYSGATCQIAGTCSKCGRTGSKASHNYNQQGSVYSYATCTANKVVYKKCQWCTAQSGTMTVSNTALGHEYTKQGTLVSEATCTAKAVYNKQCTRCTATSGTMEVGSAKGHTWVNATCTTPKTCSVCNATEGVANGHTWANATVNAPKTCSVCKTTEGNKLPAVQVSYNDPVTGDKIEFVEPTTNDGVEDVVKKLMDTPFQIKNQIFTGWFDDDNNAILKGTTRFDQMTNIKANFLGFDRMPKVIEDEKLVSEYLEFGLAGVQIRQDNTVELQNGIANGEVYGGLRFVASLSDNVFSNLNLNNLTLLEYGFVVATKENAAANVGDNENYVIKNGDKNVKRVNCMNQVDHRKFDGNYRLYTMVIDYAGNEAMKDVELVVRPYIAYTDANGVNRIFYGSYDGTVTYGGLSTSYNNAQTL